VWFEFYPCTSDGEPIAAMNMPPREAFSHVPSAFEKAFAKTCD
jgi:hypothetical protein